jgi:membrane fusion protein, multidrug efflux system
LFETRQNVVIVPTAALQHSPQSTFVYVVSDDQTVKMRNISTTLTEGDEAAVDKGLQAGEVVAVDGLDKLQDGTRVQVTLSGSSPAREGGDTAPGSKTGQ